MFTHKLYRGIKYFKRGPNISENIGPGVQKSRGSKYSVTDPLNWWKDEAKCLPILARIARKYLCACAMSAPAERVFSKAGYIAKHFRARLSAENVNKLVFLSKNL